MAFSVRKTVKNAGWLMGGKIAEMVISFIVSIFTARFLGPANKGLIDYGLAYAAFFTSVCTLGINSVLVKEFVDKQDGEGTVLGTSLVLRVVATVLSIGTICAVVAIADMGETLTLIVVLLASLRLLFQVFEVFNYWFHAQLKSKYSAVILLIAYAAAAAYTIVLLVLQADVIWFALSTSVDYACVAVLLLIAYFKNKGEKLRFSWDYAKRLLKKSCYFILPSLMTAIYAQTDKFMLRQIMGDAEIGYYATATSLCAMWVFVLGAIVDSVNPSIMQAKKDGDEALYEKRNKQLYAIVFYLSVFVSICFCAFAELAIYILYGAEYAPAAMPLRIATWYTAFSYLGVARGAWIVCENKQKYLIWVYLGAAVINVGANFALIPYLGASGAALASLLAQIATSFIVPACIPALRPNAKLMCEAIMLKGVLKEETRVRIWSFVKIFFVYAVALGAGVMTYFALPLDSWLSLLIADVVATVVVFLYSVLFNNASVYDPYWSVQPIVIVAFACIGKPFSLTWLFPLIAVGLWGLRLTANWAYTFKGMQHQDWRYTDLKNKTGAFYPFVNFFGIHMVPTLIVYACVMPVFMVIQAGVAFNPWSIPFFAVSILAATWQGIADCQMHKFRKNGTGGFIRVGLWKYSRHPNYLGEIMMWWGIAGYAVMLMPSAWYLLVGATLNTLLFLFISIPMADKRQSKKEGFAEYKRETRMLLPIPKRK